jgi:hypothetical protein
MWLVPKYVPQEELGAVLPLMSFVGFIGLPLSLITIPFLKFITVFVFTAMLAVDVFCKKRTI